MNHFFWLIIAFVFSFGLGQPGNNPGKKTVKGKALFQNGITIEIEDVDHFKDSIVFKGRPAQKTIVKTIIKNHSLDDAEVVNVYKSFCYPEIEIKRNSTFFSLMDSVCYTVVDPILPQEGSRLVKFRKEETITIKNDFPPNCLFYENGEYRIRYVYLYYLKKKKQSVKTKWFRVIVRMPQE